MAWLSFLRSRDFDPAAFERQLALLAKKITTNERNLGKYRFVHQKVRKMIHFYGIGFYVAYVGYVLYGYGWNVTSFPPRTLVLLVTIPFLLFLLIRVTALIYQARVKRTKAAIEQYRFEHESKIDDLKEKTKFSSTQALLNRFADGGDVKAELDDEIAEKRRKLDEIKKLQLEDETRRAQSIESKSWFDSIVDTVVGSEELNAEHRYALICSKCFNHNGLAPPGTLPIEVRYVCPRCGTLNGEVAQVKANPTMGDMPVKPGKENQETQEDPKVIDATNT